MVETAEATSAPPTPIDFNNDVKPALFMAVLFLVALSLAVAITPIYVDQGLQLTDDPQDVVNPAIYLVFVIAFTAVILVIVRLGREKIVKYIILGAVFTSINYVFWPLLNLVTRAEIAGVSIALAVSIVLSALMVILLYYYPEWWVIDAVGVAVAAGAAALFGISFGLLPSVLLLAGFAIYDAIAVYRTKHMIDLADSVLDMHLPIMLVVPKSKGYSFRKEAARLKEKLKEGEERDAMFMGLGDIVIPAVLVISSIRFLPMFPANAADVFGIAPFMFVALGTTVGIFAGYALLMYFVFSGRPQAGLPSLNGGALVGFLLTAVPLYGLGPLTSFNLGF
jgi:presenilin-like A22 family membrane protease